MLLILQRFLGYIRTYRSNTDKTFNCELGRPTIFENNWPLTNENFTHFLK